jgi:hypothetical protein
MNPAVLNYLQSQQQPNQMSNMDQAPQQQAPYNPFDAGINKAILSARESLGMTDKQQEKALRRSLLTFGDNIAQQPKQRGFWNNFGSVGRALSPAIMAHDDAEEASVTQNNALANQMLAYQAAEQNRLAQDEERNWRRKHAEAQLTEQRRAHDMMNMSRQQNNQNAFSPVSTLGTDYIPIESKSERIMYTKDKKASGEILQELSSIKKDYDQFKELTKGDFINPMTPYGIGSTANAGKDFLGYFSGNKKLREETSKRKALDAKLGKFAIELERKIKGGVLSEGMVKRFENKGLLPSLTDPQDVFEEKLNNLTEEMAARYKASEASLRHGVHISPYDLAQLENNDVDSAKNNQNYIGEREAEESGQNYITMIGPDNTEYDVPVSKQKLYEDNGYRISE